MRYLVIPGTTRVGRETALALAAKSVKVRSLVRDLARAAPLQNAGVEVMVGDMRSPASLAPALRDVDRVVLASPPVADLPDLERTVIDALQAAGIRRLVKCSAAAADPSSPDVFARMHWGGEERIKAAGFDFTFIRPVFFMQNVLEWTDAIWDDRRFCTPLPPAAPTAMVDLRDHAMVAAAAILGDQYSGQAHVVMNPALLTWQQVAEKLTQATGRQITYFQGDRAQFVAQMMRGGASQWTAESAANIYEHLDAQRGIVMAQVMASPFAMNTIDRMLGRPPHTFDDFLMDNLTAFM
jgi:uncharacterized protein YbjT (DUF2867 family)